MKLSTILSTLALTLSANADRILCSKDALGGIAPARQDEYWIPTSMEEVKGHLFRLPSTGCQRFGADTRTDGSRQRFSEVWVCINDEALARGKTDVNIGADEMLDCITPLCVGKGGEGKGACTYEKESGGIFDTLCGGQRWPDGKDYNCIYRAPGTYDDAFKN